MKLINLNYCSMSKIGLFLQDLGIFLEKQLYKINISSFKRKKYCLKSIVVYCYYIKADTVVCFILKQTQLT